MEHEIRLKKKRQGAYAALASRDSRTKTWLLGYFAALVVQYELKLRAGWVEKVGR